MIYYKAVCKIHDWESRLFLTETAAINSANAHRNSTAGPHNLVIQEVYIPEDALVIQKEQAI